MKFIKVVSMMKDFVEYLAEHDDSIIDTIDKYDDSVIAAIKTILNVPFLPIPKKVKDTLEIIIEYEPKVIASLAMMTKDHDPKIVSSVISMIEHEEEESKVSGRKGKEKFSKVVCEVKKEFPGTKSEDVVNIISLVVDSANKIAKKAR